MTSSNTGKSVGDGHLPTTCNRFIILCEFKEHLNHRILFCNGLFGCKVDVLNKKVEYLVCGLKSAKAPAHVAGLNIFL